MKTEQQHDEQYAETAIDTTIENADLLRDRCEAMEYLLQQCAEIFEEEQLLYVELRSFLEGRMTVNDLLDLKRQDQNHD